MSYDLNVRCADVKNTAVDFRFISLLTSCIQDGYVCTALNIDHIDMGISIKPCAMSLIQTTTLQKSVENTQNIQNNQVDVTKFEQLRRITLEINDGKFLPQLRSNKALQTYDLVAVKTRNEKVFHSLCIDYDDYDILCFEMSERLPFLPKRGWIQEAVRKGISFEITYSDAIIDAQKKRTVLANSINLIKMTKAKNLIISSSASADFDHRSPFDLVMLGSLIGLTREQALDSLYKNPANCVKRSRYRKTYEGTLSHASKVEIDEFKAKSQVQLARMNAKKIKKEKASIEYHKSENAESLESQHQLKKKIKKEDKEGKNTEGSQNYLDKIQIEPLNFNPALNPFLNPNRAESKQNEQKEDQIEGAGNSDNNTSSDKPALLKFSITN